MTSSTLFITKSTFSYQKEQKAKVAQNQAKQFLAGPILCFAYIFGELGVFLSKTVSQVQFTKTIVFLRLSWLQANFHGTKHIFHNIKHFFIPKSTRTKICSKICKKIFGRTNLVLRVYFWLIVRFPFQNGLSGSVSQKKQDF